MTPVACTKNTRRHLPCTHGPLTIFSMVTSYWSWLHPSNVSQCYLRIPRKFTKCQGDTHTPFETTSLHPHPLKGYSLNAAKKKK